MENEIVKVEIEKVEESTLVSYLDVMGIAPKLNDKEKLQFLSIAKTFGLNPFKREIFCTVYGEGQYKQFSIITGYEVYIKRAERSGLLDGWKAETTGSVANGDLKAIITIYRKDRTHPFVWEVFYDECVQKTKEGKVTKFWEKANFMTKKVAISQGFRLCFSDELGGMPYTADEMPQQEQITGNTTHEVVEPVIVQAKQKAKLTDVGFAKLVKKIEALEVSIEDAKEQCDLTETQLATLEATQGE